MLNFQVVFLKTVYQNLYSLMLMETHCLSDLEVAQLMMVELILVKTQMHVTLEKKVIVNMLKSTLIVMVTV